MRAFDIALAVFALRASPTQPRQPQQRLAPAIDDADAAMLDRAALPHEQAAMIVSLWPPARQCVVAPIYAELPAPALFGTLFRLTWPPVPVEDARALQARLRDAFIPE